MTGPRSAVRDLPVAVVLGAAVRPDGTPSPTLRLRVLHAVDLWQAGRVGLIAMTGGRGRYGPPEAHVSRDLALAEGVAPDAVIVEDRSTSTVENLAFVRPLLPPGASVALVSNRWHLPRARAAAGVLGIPVAFVSGPVGALPPGKLARAAAREALGLPSTLIRAVRAR